MFNNDYNNENNMRLGHPVYQISRKEPKFSKVNRNTEYVKRDINFDDDDDDEIESMDNNESSSNFSIAAAFDSLKKNRKAVSRGSSRNNVRINNKNCREYSYYNDNYDNDNISSNRNINIVNNEKRIYHESTSDNSIPLSDSCGNESENGYIEDDKNIDNDKENEMESENKNNSSEIIKVTPRNEIQSSNEEEQFNELYINKSYILKKFDKMMVLIN